MSAVASHDARGVVVHGIPIDEYHRLPDVSNSGLAHLERAPAIYYALHIAPHERRPPSPVPTPAQFDGQLAHCAVLEPDEFDKRYQVAPSIDKRTKEWKVFCASRDESGDRRELISDLQRDRAYRQRDSVLAISDVREALSEGVAEQSAFWTDRATGVPCRIRPDWGQDVGSNGAILLDLKTTISASQRDFAKSVVNFAYHRQAAFYKDGFLEAAGRFVHAFLFVAVEKEYPFLSAVYELDEPAMDLGRRVYRRGLETYARCSATGLWPGYATSIESLSLPPWAFKD